MKKIIFVLVSFMFAFASYATNRSSPPVKIGMLQKTNYAEKQKYFIDHFCCNSVVESNDSITYSVFKTEGGWGYDIFINGKKYIHQQAIPAVTGNNPFKTKADAEKTAELVIDKIKKNIMPPSLTPQELDSIGLRK